MTTTTGDENKLIETFVNKVSRIVEENKPTHQEEEQHRRKAATPRFQLFSAKFHVDIIRDRRTFLLSGYIRVFNRSLDYDDYGDDSTVLFNHNLHEPIPIINSLFIYNLTHPPTHCSIPIYTFPNIIFDLYAFDYDDHNLSFHVTNVDHKDFKLPVKEYDTFCKHKIKARDGSLDLVYIILTDPVDAALEIKFKTQPGYGVCGRLFAVRIIAYYDNDYGLDTCIFQSGSFYPITLLHDDTFAYSDKNRNITLDTSFVVVPAKGTLILRVLILDKEDLNSFVDNDFKFPAKRKGSSNACITNEYCSFEVKVNWKYEEAATKENDDIHTLKPSDELHQVTCEGGFDEPEETEEAQLLIRSHSPVPGEYDIMD